MKLHTCVTPAGEFVYGIHKPVYRVANLRQEDRIEPLGLGPDDRPYENRANFPTVDVLVAQADLIYEIPNSFPFRGATYIKKSWADRKAEDPTAFSLQRPASISLAGGLRQWLTGGADKEKQLREVYGYLPEPILLTLAVTSSDSEELERLASLCCEFVFDQDTARPLGLKYQEDETGESRPLIRNHALFDALANNRHLPDDYKEVMVLRPGAQGTSEIVGDWRAESASGHHSHVFEYLRSNSYIPWGHYAANMADDAIRYRVEDLGREDMAGLRHLYYQRTYVRMAEQLGVVVMARWKCLRKEDVEVLRNKVVAALVATEAGFVTPATGTRFVSTIWGWNYGFDLAPSGYRLHASHQQIHQQYAMLPATIACGCNGLEVGGAEMEPFGCGDMVAEFIREYRSQTGHDFFKDYLLAIRSNKRMDGRLDSNDSLVVYEDEHVMLFVPKAQTSQWELQLMTLQSVGNILEADAATRDSLDKAILIALRVLAALGASMVTTVEYAKCFINRSGEEIDSDQRLLYVFLPKMPEAPGGFTEAQYRWISGHYPEDFAAACRGVL